MPEHLSDRLFWDVDPQLLDWERDMPLIIKRVVERGTVEEWRVIEGRYGLHKIISVARQIRSMDLLAVNFLAQISGTPITEFRCYITKQLRQQHWIY